MSRPAPIALLLLAVGPAGCNRPADPASSLAPPADVKTVKEADLEGVTLSEEAERRLGIETARVMRGRFERARVYPGEALVPSGRSVVVASPLPGTIAPPGEGGPVPAGAHLKRGQAVCRLVPLWSPPERVALARAGADLSAQRLAADSAARTSSVEIEAARIALDRAEKLLGDKAGSARAVDEARARLRLAEASLAAAEAQRSFLTKVSIDPGSPEGFEFVAPLDGILMDVAAVPGQTVTSGASLFTVAGLDPIWIRASVYAGDLDEIDPARSARVRTLGSDPCEGRDARPAAAPPSALAGEAVVHLHYEIENAGASIRPGQRLEVAISLRGEEDRLAVPASAIVLDHHGGSWVYVKTGPRRYARRRVEVARVAGEVAVLAFGPGEGVDVVKAGAMELFGTELGFSK